MGNICMIPMKDALDTVSTGFGGYQEGKSKYYNNSWTSIRLMAYAFSMSFIFIRSANHCAVSLVICNDEENDVVKASTLLLQ